MKPLREAHGTDPGSSDGREDIRTIPNLLCALRLLGAPVLIVLAWAERPRWCLWLFVFLLMTDWLDGKLAKLLKQETRFGARLDTYADTTFYVCVLVATAWLEGDRLRPELVWIGPAVAAFLLNVAAGWMKFGSVPSYHTRLAKTSWLLVGIAVVVIFADGPMWPLRVAMAGVILTNLEDVAITLALPACHVNVPSLYHALRIRRRQDADEPPP